MAVDAHQDVVGYGVEDVVVAIGKITVQFFMETESNKFFVDFLLSGFTL